MNRKRRRSPSASSEESSFQAGKTGSPLTKRLKLSRDRRGQSKLKLQVFQDSSNHSSPGSSVAGDEDDNEDDDDASSMNEDKLEDDDELEERAEEEELEEIEGDMRDATDDEEGDSFGSPL